MSGKGQKNLDNIRPFMKNGEEPTALLLALAWSPIETLQARGLIRVFVGSGGVAVFFHHTELIPGFGLVPTNDKSETLATGEIPSR